MRTILREAYQEGRKAAELDPQKQEERRANIVNRAQAYSEENREKLKIKGSLLTEERKQITSGFERLLMGRPIEAHRQNLRMAYVYLGLFLVILAAEFWLLQWTFRPFDLGVESYVISLGLMVVGTVAIEEYLRMLYSKSPAVYNKYRLWIVFFSAIFFIVAMLLLSNARAALISSNGSTGSIEGQISTADQFYARKSLVFIAIALGSLGIAFISGLLLHEAMSRILISAPVLSQAKKLKHAEESIAAIVSKMKELEILPKKAENEYNHGLYDGPPSGVNPILSPIAIVIIAILLVLAFAIFARGDEISGTSVTLLLDMSGSVQGADYLERTEFQKNVLYVEEIIKKLEPGTHFRVLGITERSFEKPFVIIDRLISKEAGYFSEKTAKDKLLVTNEWKKQKLEARAKGTDVFGALIYASLLYENDSRQKKLLILSDLRNTTNLDLESPAIVNEKHLQDAVAKGLIADLHGVEVWALGVGTINKPYQYWNSLRSFWTKYFQKAGANLVSYSAERRWSLQNKSN